MIQACNSPSKFAAQRFFELLTGPPSKKREITASDSLGAIKRLA